MDTISNDFRGVLTRHIEHAPSHKIMAIASALAQVEDPIPFASAATSAPKRIEAIAPRFEIIQGNREPDLVRDNSTGLIWTRDNVPGGSLSWKDASAACAKLDFGGFHDWRLPTIKELLTLVEYERHNPAIDTDVFNCEPSWYWTSTPLNSSPGDYAWYVYFSNGNTSWNYRNSSGCVRAVRVGQF